VRSTLVLGLGNPILSDDGLGLYVAQRLRETPLPETVDIRESEVAGLRVLELVRGYQKVVIIDALCSGREPGEIVRYDAADFVGGHRYVSAHSIGLGTTLELGRRLGYDMPTDVVVFAVEAVDVETFGERFSSPVAQAAELLIETVRAEIGAECPAACRRRAGHWVRAGR
jgi:hydrogenase maturation protease